MAEGRIFEGLRMGSEAEYEGAIRALFPYGKDNFRMLQMLTETNSRSQMPLTILGVLRRKYKSDLLKTLQEEHNLNKVALDRKGRLELSEIVARPKGKEKEEG